MRITDGLKRGIASWRLDIEVIHESEHPAVPISAVAGGADSRWDSRCDFVAYFMSSHLAYRLGQLVRGARQRGWDDSGVRMLSPRREDPLTVV